MWQNILRHCAVLTKVSEEFAPHYLAGIRHDMRQTTQGQFLTRIVAQYPAILDLATSLSLNKLFGSPRQASSNSN
jgi:hypothetical protein